MLKVRFKDCESFLDAYDDGLPRGGLFCATTTPLEEDEEVVVEINFPGLPNKTMLKGTVVSWRAALPRLRVRAGALVQFSPEALEKRDFLLAIATGAKTGAVKRRHARLPVEMSISWRPPSSAEQIDGLLRDISVGGAHLITEHTLEIDDEIVLDLVAPGGAKPIPIVGKISNQTGEGYGVRFIYRDGGGSRRLREVVRRLTTPED